MSKDSQSMHHFECITEITAQKNKQVLIDSDAWVIQKSFTHLQSGIYNIVSAFDTPTHHTIHTVVWKQPVIQDIAQ